MAKAEKAQVDHFLRLGVILVTSKGYFGAFSPTSKSFPEGTF
jgi:hypothetical protein